MNLAKAIEYSRKPIIMGKSEHKEKSTPKPKKPKPVERVAEYKPCEYCGAEMFSLDYPQKYWERKKYCSGSCRSSQMANCSPCVIEGVRYNSLTAAAESLGVNYDMVRCRIKNENYPEWVKV